MEIDMSNQVSTENVGCAQPPARDTGYYNLLSYIVSNAISGEIMAIENYSEMVQLMPDCRSKLDTNLQAAEECRHIQMLSKLGTNLGFSVERRIVEPQWNAVRRTFSTAVKKKNLAACLIVQDLMTETMAIVLYRTLAGEADTDERTATVAKSILHDELKHLEMGVERLKAMLEADPTTVEDALVWAHHRVMPELFSMISTSCHSLCDVLGLECGSLSVSKMALDLDTIRANALNHYLDTLDKVGFRSELVNPLIASMAAYEATSSMRLAASAGCCPTPAGVAQQQKCC
jgi:fatty aldehyde decarbonylase